MIEKENTMYKGIIFDLDGVLCHTDHYHYLAWKQVADELNIHFDETINERLRGISRSESFNIILENAQRSFSIEEKAFYIDKKNKLYIDLLDHLSHTDLDQNVLQTLMRLREMGILLAIGSSSKNAQLILNKLNIIHLFNFISDGNNISQTKPHPEVFLKAAKGLSLLPKDCLVVEDAEAGIAAAIAAQMDSAAIGQITSLNIATYNLHTISNVFDILD